MEIEEQEIKFNHVMPAQLRWSDVDQFGHVTNSVYFQLFDMCKTRYVQDVVGMGMLQKTAIVVASIKADFLAPIYYQDEIEIQTRISRLGNKSFTICQRVVDVKKKEVKCVSETTMVAYDLVNNCSIPIPDDFRRKVEAYESMG